LVGMDFLRVCAVAHIAPRYLHRVWPARTRTIRNVTRVLPAQPSTRTGGSLKPGAARRRRPRDAALGLYFGRGDETAAAHNQGSDLTRAASHVGGDQDQRRGTEGSNPATSSGESSELLSCDDALAHPAQPSPQWANGEREGDGVAQAGGGYSGYCGSSSVISNQGALLRTKT